MPGKRKYGTPSNPRRMYRRTGGGAPAPRRIPKALVPKRRRRNYRASLKLARPFKQVLDKFLDKDKQTHWVQTDIPYTGIQGIPFLQPSGTPSGVLPLMPPIYQAGQDNASGVEQPNNLESREGSLVKLKSATLHLSISLNPSYGELVNGVMKYKILVLTCKKVADYKDLMSQFWNTAASPNYQNDLFMQGAIPEPWDSLMQNFQNPVNTNLFTVHAEKTGRLNRGIIYGGDGHMPNIVHDLVLKLKVKTKTLKFNEPTDSQSSNFQPFLWVGYKGYDGASLHSGNYCHIVGNFKLGFDSD